VQPRKQNRYPLDAPVTFLWRDERGNHHEGRGRARDISLGGLFVMTEVCPPLEVSVHVELQLPRLHNEAPALVVQGDGQVIRVESQEASSMGSGFAASIKRLLVRGGERALTEDRLVTPCRLGT
jgi:hypothetical protein